MDHLIPNRRPEQALSKKKKKKKKKEENLPSCGFCHPGRPLNVNKRKGKDRQILGPCLRTEKAVESQDNTNCSWCARKSPDEPGEGTVGSGDQ